MSADVINGTGWPWCAPIVRRTEDLPDELAAFAAVPTTEADPVTGLILLLEVNPWHVEQLDDPAGSLVGVTMARVAEGFRMLFDIP